MMLLCYVTLDACDVFMLTNIAFVYGDITYKMIITGCSGWSCRFVFGLMKAARSKRSARIRVDNKNNIKQEKRLMALWTGFSKRLTKR